MKNLENYGVQALNAKEIRAFNGDWLGVVAAFIAGTIAGGMIWDGIKWIYTTDVEEYGSPGGAK